MNTIERGVILTRNEFLDTGDFSMISPHPSVSGTNMDSIQANSQVLPLETVEKHAILRALELTQGNKSETARQLGITRRTLHQKLKRYGMM